MKVAATFAGITCLLALGACKEADLMPGNGWVQNPAVPAVKPPGAMAPPAPAAGSTAPPAAGMAAAGMSGAMAAGASGAAAGMSGSAAAGTGGAPDAGMGDAGAAMSATATIAPFGASNTVTGTAVFTASGTDVTVVVTLMNCPDGAHPVHIHQGTSCTDEAMQGAHWDTTRGEGIPDVTCTGMTGTSMLTRAATDPMLAWSVGGAAATNLVGHAFVVHNPGTPTAPRIGCGLIAAD